MIFLIMKGTLPVLYCRDFIIKNENFVNINQNKNHWNLSRTLRRWLTLSLRLCSWCAMCSLASIWSLYFLISSGNLLVQSPLINGAKSLSVTVSSVTNSWRDSVNKLFPRVMKMKQKRTRMIFIKGKWFWKLLYSKYANTKFVFSLICKLKLIKFIQIHLKLIDFI